MNSASLQIMFPEENNQLEKEALKEGKKSKELEGQLKQKIEELQKSKELEGQLNRKWKSYRNRLKNNKNKVSTN